MKTEQPTSAVRTLVFATNNEHKLSEVRDIFGSRYRILSLSDIGCHADIPETAETLEGNALQKVQYVHQHYGLDCFADDTGLEVDALDGRPGVHTARYAFPDRHDPEANTTKLLGELEKKSDRKARFRTVIALLESDSNGNKVAKLFEGIVEGRIAYEKSGEEGFGYDPIFMPDGYDQSFAELGADIKNTISHRARAVKKLAEYFK